MGIKLDSHYKIRLFIYIQLYFHFLIFNGLMSDLKRKHILIFKHLGYIQGEMNFLSYHYINDY